MWDGFNKRKFPRLSLHCEIGILSGDEKSPVHATTENLGVGGLCVILDKPLERFSICRVKINTKKDDFLKLEGKVVWIVPTRDLKNTKKRFDTGIEFQNIEPAQTAILRDYIEKEVGSIRP